MNKVIQILVEAGLADHFGKPVKINSFTATGGGCINHTGTISTSKGPLFLKWIEAQPYPNIFETEAKGLNLLSSADALEIPGTLFHGGNEQYAFLVMELITPANRAADFWDQFAIGLAKLHLNTNDTFGLDHDNYIGSLPQKNNAHHQWDTFFIEERLEPQIKMARDSGMVSPVHTRSFDKLFKRLEEIFPVEPPSLLHGDLWSGNYMVNAKGKPTLIDPAVYYGFREMDLAMTKLFGGFDHSLYQIYHDEFPLEKGFEERFNICNLYPLMVHVNLFGGGYLNSVEQILKKF